MDPLDALRLLATAAALGLLVGLQREHAGTGLAGIRTFPLITVFGTLCALLAPGFGAWMVAAGLLAVGAMLVAGNLRRAPEDGGGTTTEMAALLMYALGAYLAVGRPVVAVVVAGALAVLLHLKRPMHDFVHRIDQGDLRAVMQFVLITLVILPLLPDQAYGPYRVLNPRNIWLMVVLIVGVQLASYVLYRLAGQHAGTLVGGVLGGLVSSTATTVAHARRARGAPETAPFAALVIMIASTVALLRVLVVAAAVAPLALAGIAWPLGAMVVALALITAAQYLVGRRETVDLPRAGNPAELKPALVFAGIYTLVTLGIAAAKDHLGTGGLYLVALVSGLTDMDAITLSTARLLDQQQLVADVAWRVILVAALANLGFKGVAAWALGGARLGMRVGLLFGIGVAVGMALLFLWPATGVAEPVPEAPAAPAAGLPAP
jgi:uncharacterized membrane protein (DUF4010 family)